MKRQALLIELLDDCVFSASAATEGGHGSLDRIPGSALLGVAAAHCYDDLEQREAWQAFHSGRLRFSDATPWNGATPGWPAPMCWHYLKLAEYKQTANGRHRLVDKSLINFVHGTHGKAQKPVKQLRGGYVHVNGELTEPAHELRLKTAIDSTTGRASESQLFGYDALLRGQQFIAFVEADDEVDAALFDRVTRSLQGKRLLGRSRSAEYGRCNISPMNLDPPEAGNTTESTAVLWLLSDLAISDQQGNPSTELSPEALGLSGCQIDWNRTFLRLRQYSPWNTARGGFDSERAVLQAGGVVTLNTNDGFDNTQLQRLHTDGAGLYREAGLGRIWVNPPLLMTRRPRFTFSDASTSQASVAPVKPDEPLIAWLEATRNIGWRDLAEEVARAIESKYFDVLERARHWAGVTDNVDFGPSRSQWAKVGSEAKQRQGKALFDTLFKGDKAIIKSSGEGWNIEVPESAKEPEPLASWLRKTLDFDALTGDIDSKNRNRAYALILQMLADRITNHIQTRGV